MEEHILSIQLNTVYIYLRLDWPGIHL